MRTYLIRMDTSPRAPAYRAVRHSLSSWRNPKPVYFYGEFDAIPAPGTVLTLVNQDNFLYDVIFNQLDHDGWQNVLLTTRFIDAPKKRDNWVKSWFAPPPPKHCVCTCH